MGKQGALLLMPRKTSAQYRDLSNSAPASSKWKIAGSSRETAEKRGGI